MTVGQTWMNFLGKGWHSRELVFMSWIPWKMVTMTSTAALPCHKGFANEDFCVGCSLDLFYTLRNVGSCFQAMLAPGEGMLNPGLRALPSRNRSPPLSTAVAAPRAPAAGKRHLLSGECSVPEKARAQHCGWFALRGVTLWKLEPGSHSVCHPSIFHSQLQQHKPMPMLRGE